MTQTINGQKLTDGDDARMRVRAPENPAKTPSTPDSGRKSAFTSVHTRAIPDQPAEINDQAPSAVRDFVSQHGQDAISAINQSWLMTEVPPTAGEAWETALPAKGDASGKTVWLAMAAAGVFRAVAVTALHLVLLAVDTRIRAGVALILFVLVSAASCAAHNL